MTTLAEHIIVAGAKNHPPMLEKSMYDSWASRIRLSIKGKKHGRMMLDSIDNGLLVYPTVKKNGQTQPKKYSKLTESQQLQDDCDVQETNIILHGLPLKVYALVNHQETAKDIWDRVKLLMKGTALSYQEHECRLYNFFDKFASIQGETFKFVTDVKLAKSLYTTGSDQLYAYLYQHERHANEERIMRERYPNPLALCTQPKWLRNVAWFKEKLMLVEAQEADLDAYDSDCDDLSLAKAVLMANLSSCDSDVLFEESQDVVIQDTNLSAPNDLLVLSLVEQMTDHIAHLDKENQTNKMVNESLTAELKRYKERVAIFEQRKNVNLNKREKLINSQMDDLIWNRNAKLAAFQQEINTVIPKIHKLTRMIRRSGRIKQIESHIISERKGKMCVF
ncbi:hypothetical protein Tco_0801374 [Tanacetum coccineum]|uniref:Integrase, catalytic region, zinc finger, CCHC-type, peptidase aspartic, catalytic n=1 Tax=Tanacetum coccineum TaxID=301880 RepID=A0ABQ4ZY34_9ASTR